MLLLYLFFVIFATSFGLLVFFYISAGDMAKFKEKYGRRYRKLSQLPLVTRQGEIIESLEDLDVQLEVLKSQLKDKQELIEESKSKVLSAARNLQKLHETSSDVKKYYIKLKAEITKSDKDCKELQKQIEDYKKTQNKLKDEVNANLKYFHNLIQDAENEACTMKELELLTRLPIEESKFMLPPN